MQKRNFITDLKNIKTLADKIKTLNESLSFADEYDRGQYDDDEEEYGNSGQYNTSEYDQCAPNKQCNSASEVNMEEDDDIVENIREMALRGMISLCKNTENPQYDLLKKIFLLIDRSNDKKDEEYSQSK